MIEAVMVAYMLGHIFLMVWEKRGRPDAPQGTDSLMVLIVYFIFLYRLLK